VSSKVYIEGGGDSKELKARCREGFSKLLQKCGFSEPQRMPRLVPCGGRGATFDDFKTAHTQNLADYVALLVDSEDPVKDHERTWDHLKQRDGWEKPDGATDEQALLMVVCMESWIAADREALKQVFKNKLRENALPPIYGLENRDRHDTLKKLEVGYPLDSGSPNILWSALVRFGVPIGHDRAVRRGLGRDGLLDKAVEQLPAAA